MPSEAAKQTVLEDRDEYTAEGVFWIPRATAGTTCARRASSPTSACASTKRWTPSSARTRPLKGVLPKNYSRQELTPEMLGGLIDVFSREDLATEEHKDLDVLGRVYEYFLGELRRRRRQARRRVLHAALRRQLSWSRCSSPTRVASTTRPAAPAACSYRPTSSFAPTAATATTSPSSGRSPIPTTWRLAKMNLALRGIDANLGNEWGDTFHADKHPDLRADYVIANPPFNIKRLGRRTPRERPPLEVRRAAEQQRQLRLDSAHARPPRAHRHHGDAPRERIAVEPAERRRRDPQGPRSKPTSSSASWRCPASCSTALRSPSASGSSRRTRRAFRTVTRLATATGDPFHRRAQGRLHGSPHVQGLQRATTSLKIADTYHAWRGTETSDGEPYGTSTGSVAASPQPSSLSTRIRAHTRPVRRLGGGRGRRRAARSRRSRGSRTRSETGSRAARGLAGDGADGARVVGGGR